MLAALTFFGLANAAGELEHEYYGACLTDEGDSVQGEYFCLGGADGCSDGGTLSTDDDGYQSCDTGIVMCTAGSVVLNECRDALEAAAGAVAVSASDEFCKILRTHPTSKSNYVNQCYTFVANNNDETDFTLLGDGACRPDTGTSQAGAESLADCQQACIDDSSNCAGIYWSTFSGAGASEANGYSATQCQIHSTTPTSVSQERCYSYDDSEKSPLLIIAIALVLLAFFGLYVCAYWTGRPKIMAMEQAQLEMSMETKGKQVVTSSQYEDEKAEMA